MDILQNTFNEEFIELAKKATSEEEVELMLDSIPEIIESILTDFPRPLLDKMKTEASASLNSEMLFDQGFKKRNFERWEEPFNLLDLLISISIDVGENLKNRVRSQVVDDNNILFSLLVRLHARACLISKEVSCLLKSGYPDGALARWRALHETNVIIRFISKHGRPAAINYIDYEIVEMYKKATRLNEFQSKLNVAGVNDREISELKKQYNLILDKHGKLFKKPNGWANKFFSHDHIKFSEIEDNVGLDHWRPYYSRASQSVHPNVIGLSNSLGLSESTDDILLVGPSNSGMTAPGHSSAISLMQATNVLLKQYVNLDSVVIMKLLLSLSQEVGDAFLQVEKMRN